MNNRGGLFSLNRLLGRKTKIAKNSSNGLSKSSVQTLTRSTTNLGDVSPQNKITPMTAVHNAPFEQTFRITVYLPLGQLYVARIGAKTKLSELLDTICLNKLLDSSKFEFKHPTDDSQVFDLNFTIGEVGLSEIKLALNNGQDETSVRYRMSSSGHQNRLGVRPHTMSSPYSSTNSLNSTDSSGIIQRSNGHFPVIPGRKKRVAPRPPSQNSISEDPEKKYEGIDKVSQKSFCSSLVRQHFHVSSPNLTSNHKMISKLHSSTETSNESSLDSRQITNGININRKSNPLNRPLSVQFESTTSEDHKINYQPIRNVDLTSSQNHSRTSSETSDITNVVIFPEPQPRKVIGKKKAPAPPPRTISTISNNGPVASTRILQNLCVVEVAAKGGNVSSGKANNTTDDVESNLEYLESRKHPTNISKVMVNVNEIESSSIKAVGNDRDEKVKQEDPKSSISDMKESDQNGSRIIPNAQVSCPPVKRPTGTNAFETSRKNISIVDFNSTIDIDQNDIYEQVNEIIDEAVRINESKSNVLNEHKNEEKNDIFEQYDEINNNNEIHCESEKRHFNQINSEVPIHPVMNETRTFEFQEYSDNSLPISTVTSSTGPESLITSDIEDGYKGNEMDNKRKVQMTREDSKEDFIESQFGFLSEHSDDEKTVETRRCNIISSTMIADKCGEHFETSIHEEKRDVINELTNLINSNGLETFTKPSNASESVEIVKPSSLRNFQIGAYTFINQEQTKNSDFSNKTRNEQPVKLISNISEVTTENKSKCDDTFTIPKPIIRSVSFHSTLANVMDRQSNTGPNFASGLSGAPLYTSNISLSSIASMHDMHDEKDSTRDITILQKRSRSNVSIADTPSLQSIEIMKSILNSSRTMNKKNYKPTIQETEVYELEEHENGQDSQRKPQLIEDQSQNVDTILKSTSEPKTWRYQGPPSVNVSTWGERPKSLVCIKSDDDYIFGGKSKMASLQKRFSVQNEVANNNANRYSGITLKTPANCDNSSCKLPIVRGVEYKKNLLNNNTDSIQPLNSTYEISCIASENKYSEEIGSTYKPMSIKCNSNQDTSSIPEKIFNSTISKSSLLQSFNVEQKCVRVITANTIQKMSRKDQGRIETKKNDEPIFSQFTLRRTGLKEKILDECDSNIKSIINDDNNEKTSNMHKVNTIETAPKPPPMPKKSIPTTRPVLTDAIKSDPRDQLLNCIRNFNRGKLKQNRDN